MCKCKPLLKDLKTGKESDRTALGRWGVGLVVGLLYGLVVGLLYGLVMGLLYGLFFELVVGLVVGLDYLVSGLDRVWSDGLGQRVHDRKRER